VGYAYEEHSYTVYFKHEMGLGLLTWLSDTEILMNLTPGVTIETTDIVSRQTIYDLVANAGGGTIQAADLAEEVVVITTQSEAPSDPKPGQCWWDQTEQLMKVFTDVIDNTACSVWLSVGPDRFDVAMLTTEPIPFGAAVMFTGDNRKVRLPDDPTTYENTGASETRFEHCKVIGCQTEA